MARRRSMSYATTCKRVALGVAILSAIAVPGGATTPGSAWTMLGGDAKRNFYNASETEITAANVNTLIPKWRYPTIEPVTASPAVSPVNVGGTVKDIVFDADYAGNLYAIEAENGLLVWQTCLVEGQPPAPICAVAYPGNEAMQTDYGASVGSPTIADVEVDGRAERRVFQAATSSMNAVDAATGAIRWSFSVAGDPSSPHFNTSRNYEIESSALVVDSSSGQRLVIFSVDCNAYCAKPGGIWAVDAVHGHMVWFFDLVSGQNYIPPADPKIYAFSPTDIAPYSAGPPCGGVWASQSADLALGLIYAASSDCTQGSLSPYFEAVFALRLDTGAPVWSYRPRNQDQADLAFGATPNVYTLSSGRHVVGEGSKDGTYRLFDAATGELLWSRTLTVGGNFGGFYNGTTDGKRIYLTSSLGTASATGFSVVDDANKGRVFALDARTGALLWSQVAGAPTFGQNHAIPGVYLNSGLDHAVHAYDMATGSLLAVIPVGGAVSSAPVVAGGQMFVGANTGATWRSAVGRGINPVGFPVDAPAPTPIPIYEYAGGIVAYCLAADPSCQTGRVL